MGNLLDLLRMRADIQDPLGCCFRCGWEQALTGQTKRLRDYRKRLFEVIGTKARSEQFNGLQDSEVSKFLFRALNDPDNFLEYIRT